MLESCEEHAVLALQRLVSLSLKVARKLSMQSVQMTVPTKPGVSRHRSDYVRESHTMLGKLNACVHSTFYRLKMYLSFPSFS
jgi:hypothetical protein